MISLRSEELGPLTGAFFLEKTCQKSRKNPVKKKGGSFFLTGGVLFILGNIWSPGASERGRKGGFLGVNPHRIN